MKNLKKYFGIIWITLGAYAVYYWIYNQAIPKWQLGGENIISAIIYTFILCPIIGGALTRFGQFCLQNEYD